jgi:hypothetical protein
VRNGMRTLAQDGWRLVEEGITTVEEVLSVTTAKEISHSTQEMEPESDEAVSPASIALAAE